MTEVKGTKSQKIYTFEHYYDKPLPSYLSNHTDHWGYYNDKRLPPLDATATSAQIDDYILNKEPHSVTTNNYAQIGMLKSITYLDGGYTTFFYEPNKYKKKVVFDNVSKIFTLNSLTSEIIGGGVRLWKIEENPIKGTTITKQFSYYDGILEREIKYKWIDYPINLISLKNPFDAINSRLSTPQREKKFISNSSVPTSSFTSNTGIRYSKVSEKIGAGNGYTDYEFTDWNSNPDEVFLNTLLWEVSPYTTHTSNGDGRGLVKKVTIYNQTNQKLKEEENTFERLNQNFIRAIDSKRFQLGPNTAFEATAYKIYSSPFLLKKKITRTYDTNNLTAFLEQKKEFDYHGVIGLIKEEKTYNSDGKEYRTNYKYMIDTYQNVDYTRCENTHDVCLNNCVGAPHPALCQDNCDKDFAACKKREDETWRIVHDWFYSGIDRNLIETTHFVNNVLVGGQQTKWKNFAPTATNKSKWYPEIIYANENGQWVEKERFISYNADGLPTEIKQLSFPTMTFIWDRSLLKSKTFNNFTWSYDYYFDTHRMLKEATQVDGQKTRYDYDEFRRVKKIDDNISANGSIYNKTELAYNYGTGTSIGLNYVTASTTITNTTANFETQQSRNYFDGLGRTIQTVNGIYVNTATDVVANTSEFDDAGRQKFSYLPFAVNNVSLAYVPYTNLTSNDKVTNEYDGSPLNRLVKSISPTGKSSKTSYLLNVAADNVKWFLPDGTLSTTTQFPANVLFKTVVDDPNATATNPGKTFSFTDKLGRLILQRKLIRVSGSTSNPTPVYADTYYIYNDKGLLAFVLPPDATDGTSPLAYKYVYNDKNLLVKKTVPDAGTSEYVYDANDLLVASQDARQKAINAWLINEYDTYGRITKTGYISSLTKPTTIPAIVIPPTQLYTTTLYGAANTNKVDKVVQTTAKLLSNPAISGYTFTNNTITTGYNYDEFGRMITDTTNTPQNKSNITQFGYYLGADWLKKTTENHAYANNPILDIITENKYSKWGKHVGTHHQIGANPSVHLSRMAYNERDQLIDKSLNIGGPLLSTNNKSDAWQVINYSYNKDGWLTRINNPWAPQGLNEIYPLCEDSSFNQKCDTKKDSNGIVIENFTRFIKAATIRLDYNAAQLNSGEFPQGKISMSSDFDLIMADGKLWKRNFSKLLNIGADSSALTPNFNTTSTVFLSSILHNTPDSVENIKLQFEQALRVTLANSTLEPNAQAAVAFELINQFASQLGGLQLRAQNNATSPASFDGYETFDLFHEELNYDVNNNSATNNIFRKSQFNGNISEVIWQVGKRFKQSYAYEYDNSARYRKAIYTEIDNLGVYDYQNLNKFYEEVMYDSRGNIGQKNTFGIDWNGNCFQPSNIDQLTYTYDYTKGNRLIKIEDVSSNPKGFNKGNATSTAEYQYDQNGNLTNDPYKACTIAYNHLNLPTKFTWSADTHIEIVYDATGKKWRRVLTINGVSKVFDYFDGVEYENGDFKALYHSEGRVVKDAQNSYVYEYTLRDHLGNGRVYFTDVDKDNVINESDILQDESYYPFGGKMEYPGADLYNVTATPDRYQYNGKEWNDELGEKLMDYGARWYDPWASRWLSPDPLAEQYRRWSPYNYAMDNPIRFIDPDGKAPTDNILYILAVGTANKNVVNSAIAYLNGYLKDAGLNTQTYQVIDPSSFDISKMDLTDGVAVIGGTKQQAADFILQNFDKGWISDKFKENLREGGSFVTESPAINPETTDAGGGNWGYVTAMSTQKLSNYDKTFGDKKTAAQNLNVKNQAEVVGFSMLHGMGHMSGLTHPSGDAGFMQDASTIGRFLGALKGDIRQLILDTKKENPKTMQTIYNRFNQKPTKIIYDPNNEGN